MDNPGTPYQSGYSPRGNYESPNGRGGGGHNRGGSQNRWRGHRRGYPNKKGGGGPPFNYNRSYGQNSNFHDQQFDRGNYKKPYRGRGRGDGDAGRLHPRDKPQRQPGPSTSTMSVSNNNNSEMNSNDKSLNEKLESSNSSEGILNRSFIESSNDTTRDSTSMEDNVNGNAFEIGKQDANTSRNSNPTSSFLSSSSTSSVHNELQCHENDVTSGVAHDDSSAFHSCSESVDENDEESIMAASPGFKTNLSQKSGFSDERNEEEAVSDSTLEPEQPSMKAKEGSSAVEEHCLENNGNVWEKSEEEEESPVISASLIVNVSSTSGAKSPVNFSNASFGSTSTDKNNEAEGSGNYSESPLPSSRSYPPDMCEEDNKNIKSDMNHPLSSSTPLPTPAKDSNHSDSLVSPHPVKPLKSSEKKGVTFAEMVRGVPSDTSSSDLTDSTVNEEPADVVLNAFKVAAVPEAKSEFGSEPPNLDGSINKRSSAGLLANESVVGNRGSPVPADLTMDKSIEESVAAPELDITPAVPIPELNLPATVTELPANEGVKVYVVGTAHYSEPSRMDVKKTIQAVQPTHVLLELCESRKDILTYDEETILNAAANMGFDKIRATIRQNGLLQGLLHLMLLSMSAHVTKKLGMVPGGEFRTAFREAQNLPRCRVMAVDRPIVVSLGRALHALTLRQKLKLAWHCITCNDDITVEDIERCKEKDPLEKVLAEMSGEFPSIAQVFIAERDIWLAHCLWVTANSVRSLPSQMTIVMVVGMGHVKGIVKNWGKTTDHQVQELSMIPEESMTSIVMRKTIKYTIVALFGIGAYKLSRRWLNFPSQSTVQSITSQLEKLNSWSLGKAEKLRL